MSEQLEAKAVEMLDALAAKMPAITETALAAAQVYGVRRVVLGTAMVVGAIWCAMLIRWIIPRLIAAEASTDDGSTTRLIGYMASAVVAGIASIPLTIEGLSNLLDAWTWTAMLHPKLYIAAKILGLV